MFLVSCVFSFIPAPSPRIRSNFTVGGFDTEKDVIFEIRHHQIWPYKTVIGHNPPRPHSRQGTQGQRSQHHKTPRITPLEVGPPLGLNRTVACFFQTQYIPPLDIP